jgi:starvation-inducible DNA-binding protein
MIANLGLSHEQIINSGAILSGHLADAFVLSTKTRNFHWNVKGMHFSELHALFGAQYDDLDAAIDEIAERIRQLGLEAPGSLAQFLKASRLPETQSAPDAHTMIALLLKDHETIIQHLRQNIDVLTTNGDAGNADFLTGLMESHEKMAWILRSHLS